MIIVDASVVLRAFIPSSVALDNVYADSLFANCREQKMQAPDLLTYEVLNVCARENEAGRMKSHIEQVLSSYRAMKIELLPPPERYMFALARSSNITVYDAAYIALARIQKFQLATLDTRMRQVAKEMGVSIWGEE